MRRGPPAALTYGLTAIENVCEMLYPLAVGLAIADRPGRLAPWLGLWLGHLAVGLFGHVYDSRVFTRVYADLAGDMVARQRAADLAGEQVAALSREVVDFVETEVPA